MFNSLLSGCLTFCYTYHCLFNVVREHDISRCIRLCTKDTWYCTTKHWFSMPSHAVEIHVHGCHERYRNLFFASFLCDIICTVFLFDRPLTQQVTLFFSFFRRTQRTKIISCNKKKRCTHFITVYGFNVSIRTCRSIDGDADI